MYTKGFDFKMSITDVSVEDCPFSLILEFILTGF